MDEENNIDLNKDTKMDEALAEFEVKKVEIKKETPKLSMEELKLPKMVYFLIKNSGGLIKTRKVAEFVLLFIAILFFLLSFYFFFGNTLI